MKAKTIFDISSPGRKAYTLREHFADTALDELMPKSYLRDKPAELPEVSEIDMVRHFIGLSRKNYGVDNGFYPLGSCTMKYNPKINEAVAGLDGFAFLHPYIGAELCQGALEVLFHMQKMLSDIFGMDEFTLQPAAGAHGEFTGLLLIKAYHTDRGESHRRLMLVPDSSHGTNPASAHMAGYEIVQVASNDKGLVDVDDLKSKLSHDIAGIMMTNPNTLGLFEEDIAQIADLVHKAGGLLYYDGANANAIVERARPGDMGFDVLHLNLHKTFSTPHGGGGPGSGPVGVKEHLVEFLPMPLVFFDEEECGFNLAKPVKSIGRMKSYFGNFGVILRAYIYLRMLGTDGLKKVSEGAVLNARYLMENLKNDYWLKYDRPCMHEFVLSACKQKDECGVRAVDIAKMLLDMGFHPPTVYFPLIVPEALMIEPTETESVDTLDSFIDAMREIARIAKADPDYLHGAPRKMPVRRLDDVLAARHIDVKWSPQVSE